MPVEVSRLRNGVTVATHRMPHLESVAMGLWIGAGARSELPAELAAVEAAIEARTRAAEALA